jgi:hypothetical protein
MFSKNSYSKFKGVNNDDLSSDFIKRQFFLHKSLIFQNTSWHPLTQKFLNLYPCYLVDWQKSNQYILYRLHTDFISDLSSHLGLFPVFPLLSHTPLLLNPRTPYESGCYLSSRIVGCQELLFQSKVCHISTMRPKWLYKKFFSESKPHISPT